MGFDPPSQGPAAPSPFGAHTVRIQRHILSMVKDPSEAEDLTQEVFSRARVHRASLREEGAALAWRCRTATDVSLDRLRQRTRRAPMELAANLDDVDPADPDEPPLQRAFERSEISICARKYVADLRDPYRSTILLHDMHGMSTRKSRPPWGARCPR